MSYLPTIASREDYLRAPRDEATYRAAIDEICRRHALPPGRRRKYAGGSTIVFAVGESHVVKLFEPIFTRAAATERAALARVQGRVGIPTPGLLAAGELDGWSYVVMEQLRGVCLKDAWPGVPREERLRICREVGTAAARMHALPADGLPALEVDWAAFIAAQRDRCIEHQRRQGLAEAWLRQIPAFLEGVDLGGGRTDALLHTEIMREHLLVEGAAARWEITGLLDFEPAMIGDPAYDLASVGIFLCGAEPGLFPAFLAGYGPHARDLTADLQRRVLAYALLHRYSNLRWYLETVPPRARTLEEVAEEWWPLE